MRQYRQPSPINPILKTIILLCGLMLIYQIAGCAAHLFYRNKYPNLSELHQPSTPSIPLRHEPKSK